MTRKVAMFCFALLCMPATAALDSEAAPFDYIRPVKGGKYIFVMLQPVKLRKYAYDYQVFSDTQSYKRIEKEGLLFKKYPASGLYLHNGSTKPLWTVDWYSFDVRACSDGVHLVRFGPWAPSGDDGKTLAVAFYKSGNKIRSYAVRDLIEKYEELPHSVSHYQWMSSSGFDDVGKRLKIVVLKGYRDNPGPTLLFDIRTGRRLGRK